MKNGTCPKCASTDVMADVTVRDVGHAGPYPLRVEMVEKEPAQHGFIWSPKAATGDIRAWICAQCGYTELYTDNLETLHQIYKSGQ